MGQIASTCSGWLTRRTLGECGAGLRGSAQQGGDYVRREVISVLCHLSSRIRISVTGSRTAGGLIVEDPER